MNVILPQALLVHFLLIELSLKLFGDCCFYDMINYVSELLAILKIYKDIVKEIYI